MKEPGQTRTELPEERIAPSEVEPVLARALAMQAKAKDELSLAELQEIAAETGADPETVTKALAEHRARQGARAARRRKSAMVASLIAVGAVSLILAALRLSARNDRVVNWGRTLPSSEYSLVLAQPKTTMGMLQRQWQAIPGSEGRLSIRLGDITGGQVLITVEDEQAVPVVHATSIRPGDAVAFRLGPRPFYIRLTELRNVLIGDDSAVLTVSAKP